MNTSAVLSHSDTRVIKGVKIETWGSLTGDTRVIKGVKIETWGSLTGDRSGPSAGTSEFEYYITMKSP